MKSLAKLRLHTAEKDDPCWEGYEMIGLKDKDGKQVPNCVPKENSTMKSPKNRREALKLDKSFYAEFDDDTGYFCVFGDNTGFCYDQFNDKQSAERRAKELIKETSMNFNEDDWSGPYKSKKHALESIIDLSGPPTPKGKKTPYCVIEYKGRWFANDGVDPNTGKAWNKNDLPKGTEFILYNDAKELIKETSMKVEATARLAKVEKAGDTPTPLMKGQVGGMLDIMRDKDSPIWKFAKANGDCGDNMEQTLQDFYEYLEDQED